MQVKVVKSHCIYSLLESCQKSERLVVLFCFWWGDRWFPFCAYKGRD